MDRLICLLPGGYVDKAGQVHRWVELVPLSGREEEVLASRYGSESPSLITGLLSRCIQRVGSISPVSEGLVRDLLVADRQYLLLKLRELTFGPRIRVILRCPWPDCGNRFDVDFSTADVPVRASEDKGPLYEIELSPEAAFVDDDGVEQRQVTFRLPNGADQEVISPLVDRDEAKASAALLSRCLYRIGPLSSAEADLVDRLSPQARREIEGQMEAVAPQVELTMEGDCPDCGREFATPFDLSGFVLNELRVDRDLLYREVHYLAYHYHWSEREIMEMSRPKRRKYIEVLAQEFERLNDAI